MFLWGDADLIWTQCVLELFRSRRRRRERAEEARRLVAEAEIFLAGGWDGQPLFKERSAE